MIKISVIIPVYNCSQYLRDCLDSVLQQSFCDYELLIIDDGSEDDSGKICDEYAQTDSRIRVFHQRNRGVSVARNVALDNVKGEWITFIDADDILLPEALRKLYETVSWNDTDIVLGGSNVYVNGKIFPYHTYNSFSSTCVIDNMSHPALWAYMIRSAIIKNNNIRFIPGLAYSEDAIFLAEVAVKSKSIVHISDIVYLYRRNDNSACAVKDGVMMSNHQFYAAYALKNLIEEEKNSSKKNYLLRKQRALIRGGCYDYASHSFSLLNYPQYQQQYLQYFEGRISLFVMTIKYRIVFLRRKLISFRDNPLTGELGMITKIHTFYNRKMKLTKYWRQLKESSWLLGICENGFDDLQGNCIHWISNGIYEGKKWFADPFILDYDEKIIHLLVEEFDFKVHRGRIAMLTVDRKMWLVTECKILLDLPTHLSFPMIWQENDQIYVCPENYHSGGWSIYQYDSEKKELVFLKQIINEKLTDATIWKNNNDYFLFSTYFPTPNGKKLTIWKADELMGSYKKEQEIVFDENIGRNAGSIFNYKGIMIRPAQESNYSYGHALVFQKMSLTDGKFVFEELSRINSNHKKYREGMHTFNQHVNGMAVLDVKGWRYPRIAKIIGLVGKLLIALHVKKQYRPQ